MTGVVPLNQALVCRFIPTISNMTSSVSTVSSATVSFYKSDLEAITAFIKDRMKFLDTIIDAVNSEEYNSDAERCVALLEKSPYFVFLPDLITESTTMCENALLALGNCISSNNNDVSVIARRTAFQNFNLILNCFKDPKTEKVASYIVYCLSKSTISPSEITSLLDVARTYVNSASAQVAREMLFIIYYFGDMTDVSTKLLLEFLASANKKAQYKAVRLLGEQVSEDDFDKSFTKDIYDYVRKYLMSDIDIHTNVEVAWTLANLMTEPHMGDVLFADSEFYEFVLKKMSDYANPSSIECCWALLNAFYKCDKTMLSTESISLLESGLDAYRSWAKGYKIAYEIDKITTMITCEKDLRKRNAVPLSDDLLDMEIDDATATTIPSTPQNETTGVYLAPMAWEVLAKHCPRRTVSSRTVLDVIKLVENNPFYPVAVPKHMLFSAADLMDLAALGYSIVNGCIGVSHEIFDTFNAQWS